jgi:hypothetical protein
MRKMIFVHVMKSAGTTMRSALLRIYGEKLLYDRLYKRELYKNRDHDTKHFVILDNQRYPDRYKKYDAIIGHFKWDKYEHLNWPLVTFLRDPVDRMVSAYYYLQGNYKKLGYNLNIIEFAKLINNQVKYVVGDLDKYEFIGITEEFDKSFNLMCEKFDLNKISNIQNKRVSGRGKKLVKRKVREKIRDIIIEDVKLYDEARRRFENIIS